MRTRHMEKIPAAVYLGLKKELVIPPAHRIRWTPFCCACFFFILLIYAPSTGFVYAQPQSDPDAKNVLVLHSFETKAPVFAGTDRGLSEILSDGGILIQNQFFISLDLRRNPGPEYRRLLVEEMRMMSNHRKFDIIVTMYPEALEFVLQDCPNVFADVPILAMYLPSGFVLPKTDRLIIEHSALRDITGTFEIALKLVPGAKHVYVVSGAHQMDRAVEAQARRDLRKWEGRLEFQYLKGDAL